MSNDSASYRYVKSLKIIFFARYMCRILICFLNSASSNLPPPFYNIDLQNDTNDIMLDSLNNNTIPCQSNPVSKSDLNTSSSSSVSPSVTNCLGPDEEIAEDDEFESFYGFTNSDIDIAKGKRLMIENFDNNYTSYSDIQSLRRSVCW